MGEGLRRTGSTALRHLPAALRREHFVSHVYMVPDATDKTRDVAVVPDRTTDPNAGQAAGFLP
jgi:hypothetical protein